MLNDEEHCPTPAPIELSDADGNPVVLGSAWHGGHRQVGVQGDPWQLDGTLVIVPPDRVLFTHVSREAGDHAQVQDLLQALDHHVKSL